MEAKFKCKKEELPVLGAFLEASLIRDYTGLSAKYSGVFTPQFQNTYHTKLVQVENIVNPKKLVAQQKKITETLNKDMNAVRGEIDIIEGHVKSAAGNLDIDPKDFGFKTLRNKINRKDAEGVLDALKVVIGNIDGGMAALVAKGMTQTDYNNLVALRDAIKSGNEAQNAKMDERDNLAEANMEKLNDFWDMMSDIMDKGKRVYKGKKKVDDYTFTKLKVRVRIERKKRELEEKK